MRNLLKIILTPGQWHKLTQPSQLIQDMGNTWVLADKGYDHNAFVEKFGKKDCTPVIPSKRNRKHPRNYDEHIYKERHLADYVRSNKPEEDSGLSSIALSIPKNSNPAFADASDDVHYYQKAL